MTLRGTPNPKNGSMWMEYEGITIHVRWDGGALSVDEFVKALNAISELWSALSGKPSWLVPATAMGYSAGENDE